MRYSVLLYLLLVYHLGPLILICIKFQAVIRGFDIKKIVEDIQYMVTKSVLLAF